ncbi:MAG: PIN domain-containing protein [Thaumarchaeota archaeon]|nr:PIN domain-containing protein [Nitrososphaerota archaeon]
MTRFIVDSWAWIEYLRGSRAGQKVREKIEHQEELLTHIVTIAEIMSKLKRESLDTEGAWKAITASSKLITIDANDAKNTGLLHAYIKRKNANFSLADAFVLHAAKKLNGKVLTGDPDFKGINEAILLR